jgi:hypothetical protein
MAEHYNNVPMSDDLAKKVREVDASWTGPKLVLLSFITLAAAFTLLYCMADGILGPTVHP